jgi:hypothetical protein
MSDSAAPTDDRVVLFEALLEVAEAIPFIEKRGENSGQNYKFAQAVDVTRELRSQLFARGIIVIPGTVPGSVRHFTETGGSQFVTTVDLVYRFVDVASGAEVVVEWAGAGADRGGDKGLYKAYTGGLKYALLSLFLLPTTDDPEHDALSQQPGQAQPPAADTDDNRPAAPLIPLDRAKGIATAAVAAGMASWGEDNALEMEPLLKAKLADLGVGKIGGLNVDQAEELEQFIAAETPPAAPDPEEVQ